MKATAPLSLAAGAAILLCPSCKSYDVSLTYAPPAAGERVARGKPVVAMGRVNDSRDVTGTEIGAIRNEVGIPIKTLHAKRPVAQITHNAFSYALKTRGMVASRGKARYTLSADVLELWCHQFATQDAGCRIRVTLRPVGSTRVKFSKVYEAKRSRPSPNVTYWSKVDELATVTSEALQSVVDGAVDDPDFRRALR